MAADRQLLQLVTSLILVRALIIKSAKRLHRNSRLELAVTKITVFGKMRIIMPFYLHIMTFST